MSSTVFSLIVVAVAFIGSLVLWRRRRKEVEADQCVRCHGPSLQGYSTQAEDIGNIQPMCTACLISQLRADYGAYSGLALVIEPAKGPPCYVFQPSAEWSAAFPDTRIAADVEALLSHIAACCEDCGDRSRFLWVQSRGFTGDTGGHILEQGVSATLLLSNPEPEALCAKCCVNRISTGFARDDLRYAQVCAPRGEQNGFVVPMAY